MRPSLTASACATGSVASMVTTVALTKRRIRRDSVRRRGPGLGHAAVGVLDHAELAPEREAFEGHDDGWPRRRRRPDGLHAQAAPGGGAVHAGDRRPDGHLRA